MIYGDGIETPPTVSKPEQEEQTPPKEESKLTSQKKTSSISNQMLYGDAD